MPRHPFKNLQAHKVDDSVIKRNNERAETGEERERSEEGEIDREERERRERERE